MFTVADRRVLLIYWVLRFDPFQRITDEDVKFEPSTVIVKPAPPIVQLSGLTELMDGAIFCVIPSFPPLLPVPPVVP